MISAQQIEQFCRIENYKLLVSAEKQLADPLFSSYSVPILCHATKRGLSSDPSLPPLLLHIVIE